MGRVAFVAMAFVFGRRVACFCVTGALPAALQERLL